MTTINTANAIEAARQANFIAYVSNAISTAKTEWLFAEFAHADEFRAYVLGAIKEALATGSAQ